MTLPSTRNLCLPSRNKPGLAAGFCLLLLLPFSNPAYTQSDAGPVYLIFEPVRIETTTGDNETLVTELTSLPSGENPVSTSEYFAGRLQAESEFEALEVDDSITEFEQKVIDLELAGGAYEPGLVQELLSLANLYQSRGEHASALTYLEQAHHVNRVNLGLFNLDQENILEEKIESYIALGDMRAANSEQEYLFYLKRKAFGSDGVKMLPALTRYAEWNIFAFDARLIQDPSLFYGANPNAFSGNRSNNSVDDEAFKIIRLQHAQFIYQSIVQILRSNFGMADPRLMDVEKRLALTSYFFATNLGINGTAFNNGSNNAAVALGSSQGFYDMSRVASNSMGYRNGRQALERRLEYVLHMEESTPQDIARARIELGDWLLIFKKRASALETYEEAYREMAASGASEEELNRLFTPLLPQTIPDFIDYRYTRNALNIPEDMALDYQGWLDVSIDIDAYGRPNSIKVFGTSPESDTNIEEQLIRHLRSSTSFRPRFRNGELVGRENIQLRYYYTY